MKNWKNMLFIFLFLWTSRGFYSMHLATLFINNLPDNAKQSAYIIPTINHRSSLVNYRVVYLVFK